MATHESAGGLRLRQRLKRALEHHHVGHGFGHGLSAFDFWAVHSAHPKFLLSLGSQFAVPGFILGGDQVAAAVRAAVDRGEAFSLVSRDA